MMGEAFQRSQGKEGFFYVPFFSLLDEGSNNEIRAAPTGQVCYALAARMRVRYCVH